MPSKWRAPDRKPGKITQTYNDGVVKIYTVTDTAVPGYAPVRTETLIMTIPFERRTVGVERYYSAAQNQIRITGLIRVPAISGVTSQEIAEIGGTKYRIDQVQTVSDVYPPSMDLALTDYEQREEASEGEGEDGNRDVV